MSDEAELLPGTLDLLILKAVSLGPLHGYGVPRLKPGSMASEAISGFSLTPACAGALHEAGVAVDAILSETKSTPDLYDSVLKGGEQMGGWLGRGDAPDMEQGEAIRAQGAVLRQLHAWLKEKDASFGGLVRVQNKRQEFLWVHPQFEKEY